MLVNMPDDGVALSDPASTVDSPGPHSVSRQQAACLACREAKQKCSKGNPW